MDVPGKVALVTGGSKGIGRAVVVELARAGCRVAFTYRSDEAAAHQLVQELQAEGCTALAIRADMANTASLVESVNDAARELGGLDILVNNVGHMEPKLLFRTSEADLDDALRVNYIGAVQTTKAALPYLTASGSGRVINISSANAIRGRMGQVAYAGAKAALNAFTLVMSKELARKGVTVNAVLPGVINSGTSGHFTPEAMEEYRRMIPLGRAGDPAEVARVVRFLASELATYVTGVLLPVDGGLTA